MQRELATCLVLVIIKRCNEETGPTTDALKETAGTKSTDVASIAAHAVAS